MIAQNGAEIVRRHVKLTVEGIDRMYLNVFVPGLAVRTRERSVLPGTSRAAAAVGSLDEPDDAAVGGAIGQLRGRARHSDGAVLQGTAQGRGDGRAWSSTDSCTVVCSSMPMVSMTCSSLAFSRGGNNRGIFVTGLDGHKSFVGIKPYLIQSPTMALLAKCSDISDGILIVRRTCTIS